MGRWLSKGRWVGFGISGIVSVFAIAAFSEGKVLGGMVALAVAIGNAGYVLFRLRER